MGVLRETVRGFKPLIFTCWIVAAVRLILEANTDDLNVVAMFSVYGAIAVVYVYSALTGILDHLGWKRILLGAPLLGVACFMIPNAVAYGVAQSQGWQFGRYYADMEIVALERKFAEADPSLGFFDLRDKAEKALNRKDKTRGPPIGRTTSEKVQTVLTVAAFTTVAGTVWSLVWGVLLVGIPGALRKKRGG